METPASYSFAWAPWCRHHGMARVGEKDTGMRQSRMITWPTTRGSPAFILVTPLVATFTYICWSA